MSEEIRPCPFCGGSNTLMRENKYWTGKSNQILSVEIQHWCDKRQDSASQLTDYISFKGKTREEALLKWNTRHG